MFELSIASKYLIPKWRQLSVSIISTISVLVISLVVWLIVVFFSVVNGLEKSWIEKLIALTAPVRITPTEKYYNSYYYLADSISSGSDYSLRTIEDKLLAEETDPYNPAVDEEIPKNWAKPDLDKNGKLKDLVKETFSAINNIKNVDGLSARQYEMTVGNLRLRLIRENLTSSNLLSLSASNQNQGFLSQTTYLGSFDPENALLAKSVQPIHMEDVTNVLQMIDIAPNNNQEDSPNLIMKQKSEIAAKKLKDFFEVVTIQKLKTPSSGWKMSKTLLPKNGAFHGVAFFRGTKLSGFLIPVTPSSIPQLQKNLEEEGFRTKDGLLLIEADKSSITFEKGDLSHLPLTSPLYVEGGVEIDAKLIDSSLENSPYAHQILFNASLSLQGLNLKGEIPLDNLSIAEADIQNPPTNFSLWATKKTFPNGLTSYTLPSDVVNGDGVFLPRSFRESGTFIGDRGYLSYLTPTTSSVQEQRVPIFVAGFYDPGIIPIGGKYILANPEITGLIRASHNQDDNVASNGINVRFNNLNQADAVKTALLAAFKKQGIDPYWHVETFQEYDFTKDLIQQLHSEANLFTLISIVIIIVACSNIISMLIILVNDKKMEIGILRSMGAGSASIAMIFGICGMVMGVLGSVIGTIAALLTLQNLSTLISFISKVQGYEMFNPMFYGDTLPTELSFEALAFVLLATAFISLLAGIVPAVKACLLQPSAILKSE
jgi:lipoprotein-releasing system permease protein